MNKLIKYFNEKYGKEYGKIAYPRTTIQIYQAYQIVKDYNIEDSELQSLLQNMKLPNPKTIEEREMYSECFGEVGISDEMLPCYIKEVSILKISKEELENGRTFKDDETKNIIINKHLDLEDKDYKIKYKNNIYDFLFSGGHNESKQFMYEKSSGDIIGIMTNMTLDERYQPVESEDSYIIVFTGEFLNAELFDIEILGMQIKKIDTEVLPDDMTLKNSLTIGKRAGEIGEYSFASGENVKATKNNSHAEGNGTTASGYGSHAEGRDTIASGGYSHAEGSETISSSNSSHAEGNGTTASGSHSHAEGDGTTALGSPSHAEGSNTTASGNNSHAEGSGTKASGNHSHAEGYNVIAEGYSSHAEGNGTTALENGSHAEGGSSYNALKIIPNLKYNTTTTTIKSAWDSNNFSLAKGVYSHVEGLNGLALGECSHAEGNSTIALGKYSHAEGCSTKATKDYSHAEGYNTETLGEYSHAEGHSCKTLGSLSHAEGSSTIAKGATSHAEGNNTIATSSCQHVQGRFNIEDTDNKYAHIVGNGTFTLNGEVRSNAHTLDWDGNAWYAGKLSQDGEPTDDKDLVTKKYVDTNNNRLLTSIYGKRYNFQINEDDFNSLYNLLYGDERGSMEINLNSVSIDGINEILNGDVWYDVVSFNNVIILNVGAIGSNGITLFMKDETLSGEIAYISFTLNINESNIPVFSYYKFTRYNINDKLTEMAGFSNQCSLSDSKYQYIDAKDNIEIILPNANEYMEIHLYFSTISAITLTFSSSIKWDKNLIIEANKSYELIFKYINAKMGWIGEYKVYS